MVLVELNVAMALKLANKGYVIEAGRITIGGSGSEVLGDERVRKACIVHDIGEKISFLRFFRR